MRLEKTPANAKESERLKSHGGNWYEVISTLERLSQITRIEYRTPAVLSVAYKSISGKQYELHHSHELPDTVVFYVRQKHLVERLPGGTESYTVTHMVPEQRVRSAVYSIATAIVPPPAQPDGVDLLVESVEFDAAELTIGETKSHAIEVNRYLNASGQLVMYLLVTDPTHGRYRAELYVNGRPYHHFHVDTFVPPVLRFPGDEAQKRTEIARLSAIFRQNSPPSISTPANSKGPVEP